MSDAANLVLEHLKRIQAEQDAARDSDEEILSRLARLESGLARITQDKSSKYAELVEDRHALDRLRERVDRIERRLEIS